MELLLEQEGEEGRRKACVVVMVVAKRRKRGRKGRRLEVLALAGAALLLIGLDIGRGVLWCVCGGGESEIVRAGFCDLRP